MIIKYGSNICSCHTYILQWKNKTALDYIDLISKINDLYTTREHRKLHTILMSVSHQYLKNTLDNVASEDKSVRLEVYQIILAFYSQFCEPKKSQNILYISLCHLSINYSKM